MWISWTEKKSNELVLKEANLERSLIKNIRQRQLQLYGHICRHKSLEHLAITGKIEGKHSRGGQRITFIKNLKSWATGKGSNNNFIRSTENRFEWGNMIANFSFRQGQSAGGGARTRDRTVTTDLRKHSLSIVPQKAFDSLVYPYPFYVYQLQKTKGKTQSPFGSLPVLLQPLSSPSTRLAPSSRIPKHSQTQEPCRSTFPLHPRLGPARTRHKATLANAGLARAPPPPAASASRRPRSLPELTRYYCPTLRAPLIERQVHPPLRVNGPSD
ncbi:endonuclease-reverse transcriptase [Plakobranchus ocellatus]|uniref:Endonuclease-reverse transcriptase n=1 Tax=Plakobranchus ocellatus TaxID=259542 RepID=A0AAV4DVX7_9GAST|nr:endonuclease-reverse transcriptase [Plakobranchus ocellatus]